jgi:hypothetical protein
MLKQNILFLSFITFSSCFNCQINDENIRLKVLRKNVVDKEFVFGKWEKNKGSETHLTYLGKVNASNGRTYKIMNSIWIWGLSKRATSRILIFNKKNQYLGNYSMFMTDELPMKLQNKQLIFINSDSNCNTKIITKVSLKDGLPKQFFKECKNKLGNIYGFDGLN